MTNISFVPVMTSNTTPSGLAFASSSQFGGEIGYYPWMAFEPLTGYGNTWVADSGDTPQYIGYKTTGNYKLDSIKYTAVVNEGMPFPPPGIKTIEGAPTNFKVQGSNNTTDGSNGTWIDLATFTNVTWNVDSPTQTFNVASNTSYSSFRIYMTSLNTNWANTDWANTNWAQCEYLEFIQSPEIPSSNFVPVMTSNTTPSGLAFANSVNDDTYDWGIYKAFDGNLDTLFISNLATPVYPTVLGYISASTHGYKVDSITYKAEVSAGDHMMIPPSINGAPTNFKVQGSNNTTTGLDGTWDDLATFSPTWELSEDTQSFQVSSDTAYIAHRISVSSWADGPMLKCMNLEFIQSPEIPSIIPRIVNFWTI